MRYYGMSEDEHVEHGYGYTAARIARETVAEGIPEPHRIEEVAIDHSYPKRTYKAQSHYR